MNERRKDYKFRADDSATTTAAARTPYLPFQYIVSPTGAPPFILCVCVEGSIHTVNRRALGKTCSASSSLSVKFSPQPEMLRKVHFWGEGDRNESLCGRAFSSIIKVFRLQ